MQQQPLLVERPPRASRAPDSSGEGYIGAERAVHEKPGSSLGESLLWLFSHDKRNHRVVLIPIATPNN